MDVPLKQRLIGAAVLVALAVIFLPMLLKGPDVKEPDAAQVPLSMPQTPGQEYETRELPLTEPEGTAPAGGVLGMTPAEPEALPVPAAAAPAAVATVAAADVPDLAPAAAAPVAVPAVTPVPPPAATVPAAVAAGKYLVNIGSFSNLANADALIAKLRAQKLPVLADKVALANGSAMRVRVGPYADRATAEAARLRAEELTGTPGKVVASDAPASALAARPATPVADAKPAAAKPATASAPAPKPAPTSASAPTVGFAVQLSAPSVEAEAIALRDKARAQGFNAFVQPVETDSGRRYRVRVGPVADRGAAEALRDEVAGRMGSKGIVVANP
jgi:DedD protein